MSEKKPVWKRSFDGTIYADFLDGRGIVLYSPHLAGRSDLRVCDDGWRAEDPEGRKKGKNWPSYNNEQPTEERPHHNNGLRIYYYQGKQYNFLLTPNQTKLWNEHHGFKPYVPDPREEERKRIKNRIWDADRNYRNALAQRAAAQKVIDAHPNAIADLKRELDALDEQEVAQ